MLIFYFQPDLHVALDTWALETVRSLDPDFRRSFIPMSEPLTLSLGQKFEMERMSRAIDSTLDIQTLQGLAKQLLQAWHSQKAATQWMMRQQLDSPSRVAQELAQRPDVIKSLQPGTPQPSYDVL